MTDLSLKDQIVGAIDDEMYAYCGDIRGQEDAADAILELLKGAVTTDAVEALSNYQQADMDGIIVTVSRQAIEECLPVLRILAALGVK